MSLSKRIIACLDVRDGKVVKGVNFENLRDAEARNLFDNPMLATRPNADPEAFKVRRGKIGGFRDHLSAADVARIVAGEAERGCGRGDDPVISTHHDCVVEERERTVIVTEARAHDELDRRRRRGLRHGGRGHGLQSIARRWHADGTPALYPVWGLVKPRPTQPPGNGRPVSVRGSMGVT